MEVAAAQGEPPDKRVSNMQARACKPMSVNMASIVHESTSLSLVSRS